MAFVSIRSLAGCNAVHRSAFGKLLVDHEAVGFMLADNAIDLKQAELIIDWCAGLLDSGASGKHRKFDDCQEWYRASRPFRP